MMLALIAALLLLAPPAEPLRLVKHLSEGASCERSMRAAVGAQKHVRCRRWRAPGRAGFYVVSLSGLGRRPPEVSAWWVILQQGETGWVERARAGSGGGARTAVFLSAPDRLFLLGVDDHGFTVDELASDGRLLHAGTLPVRLDKARSAASALSGLLERGLLVLELDAPRVLLDGVVEERSTGPIAFRFDPVARAFRRVR